jgi:hypothetical protein
MRRQLLEVLFGAVAFMREKIIVRKLPMILGHQAIPGHFRHDGSRRDGHAQQIALNDGTEWEATPR